MNNPHHHHDRVPPETDRRHAAQRHGLHLRAHCRHTRHAGLAAVLDCAAAGPPAAHQGAGCRAAEVAVPLPEVPAPHLALTPLPCPLRPSFSIPPSPPRSGEFFFAFSAFSRAFCSLLLLHCAHCSSMQAALAPPRKACKRGMHACVRRRRAAESVRGKIKKKFSKLTLARGFFTCGEKAGEKRFVKGAGSCVIALKLSVYYRCHILF